MPLASSSYFTGYDSSASPQISSEFATAAFRMGHSLIRQKIGRSNINQNYTNLKINLFFSLIWLTGINHFILNSFC